MNSEIIALLSAVIVAVISAGSNILLNRMTRKDAVSDERAEQDNLVRKAVMVMLHDRLYQACRFYIGQGEVDESGYQNVTELYQAYHAMGGNGTGTKLYTQVEDLWITGGIENAKSEK